MRPIGRNKMRQRLQRGQATRQHIIEQSAALFNVHGYSGTSMSALMAVTGLEKGGLYRHFESKEELAAAAFDYAWQAVQEPRLRGLDECPTALEKLLLLVKNFLEQPRTLPGGCPLLNTAIENDDGNAVLRHKARAALAEWRLGVAKLVRHGQRSRELRKDIDAMSVATIVIAGLEGAVMQSRLERSREPLCVVTRHLEAYLRSLSMHR